VSQKTEKSLSIGGVDVTIAVDRDRAERLRNSFLYRSILGPGVRRVRRLRRGEGPVNGAGDAEPALQELARPLSAEAGAILERIADIEWYHTIELPYGVATPGFVDHRPQLELYGLPQDMRGMRALDVATYDGFWAFEMERRGADVTAIDIGSWAEFDIPSEAASPRRSPGRGSGQRTSLSTPGSSARS